MPPGMVCFRMAKQEPAVEELLRTPPLGEAEPRQQLERRGRGRGSRDVIVVFGWDFPPRVHDPLLREVKEADGVV